MVPEPKRTIGKIVGGWFLDESFYRDITTRTLSIGVAALLGYLGAVVLGIVGPPPREAIPAISAAFAAVVMAAVILVLRYRGHRRWTLAMFVLFAVLPQLVITWQEPWFAQKPPPGWFYTPMALAFLMVTVLGWVIVRRYRSKRRRSG